MVGVYVYSVVMVGVGRESILSGLSEVYKCIIITQFVRMRIMLIFIFAKQKYESYILKFARIQFAYIYSEIASPVNLYHAIFAL